MPLTADQIHAQALWEQEGVRRGVERYRALSAVVDPSTLPPGKAMMRAIVPPLVEAIRAAQDAAARDPGVAPDGSGGRLPPDLFAVHLLSPETAAVITAGCLLRAKEGALPVPLTGLAQSVARSLRFQVEMERWVKQSLAGRKAGVWDALASFRSAYPSARARDWRRWRKKLADLVEEQWSPSLATHVGARFIRLAAEACPQWITLSTVTYAGKTRSVVKLAPEAVEILKDLDARAEVSRPYRMPMVIPPNPWRYA